MRKSKKKEKIVKTAQQLFFRYGLKRVTIEEICMEANASKVTFYKYFRNKQALAEQIRDDMMDSAFAAYDEINKKEIPFLEKIKEMTQWHMDAFSKMNNVFIREIAVMNAFEAKYKEGFLNNLKTAQRNGELRSELDLEFIYIVVKKLNEITRDEDWKNIFSDYGHFVEQLRTILFFGLLVRHEV